MPPLSFPKISLPKNFFVSRKTTTSAEPSSVAQQRQVKAGDTTPPRRGQAFSEKHRNNTSIFARIASSFKALSFKAIKERNQSRAETNIIRKEIKNNMPDLKANMPSELQKLRDNMQVRSQEISAEYIKDFPSLKKTFTDEEGTTASLELIMSVVENNLYGSSSEEGYKQHLIRFCGGDRNQASTLSTLLTSDTVKTVKEQIRKNSSALHERLEVGTPKSEIDIRMMKNQTARVVITRKFDSSETNKPFYAATIKTTIDVPREPVTGRFYGLIGKGHNFENPVILKNVNCKYVFSSPAPQS